MWDVWTARMSGWNYVAYQRRDRTRSVVDLDLKAFIDESVRRGITSSSWYLIAAGAGFEIWRRGGGTADELVLFPSIRRLTPDACTEAASCVY